jgi:phenylacetate-coenzyme A ligase PaaK-like adenylate-forming protein
MIARVLWLRRLLRQHERWSPNELQRHQDSDLAVLRRFATSHSPFYRAFHQGMERAPLAALPPLTKADLMDHFDEISTEPAVRLADVQAYLDDLCDDLPFRDRYWVSATSGSSGRRSVIVSSAQEWSLIIAGYGRASEWSGIRSGLTHKVSMAVVSSTTPWHQSARVAATVRSPFILSERLDAASPLPDIVARLNRLRPDVLVAYASIVRILADEQLAGRLQIAPRAVNSSSEVLTSEARAMATARGILTRSTSTPPPRPAASPPNAACTTACICSRTS